VIGAQIGPVGLVLALALAHYLNLALTIRLVAGQLGIGSWSIVKDILPNVLLALLMAAPLLLLNGLSWSSSPQQLAVSIAVGVFTYVGLSELLRSRDHSFVKELVRERLLRARGVPDGVA
jgi:peptidoglycan biosynthesis protein MviN/MurJ (putative lipid II flippase)